MRLIKFEIEALYGLYNYFISFNPDVTFLYGQNGCGKTTVLNLIEIITTGQLHKLFCYKFGKFKLSYVLGDNSEDIRVIEVVKKHRRHSYGSF